MKRVMFLIMTIVMMTTSTMSNNYDPYAGVVVKAQAQVQVPVAPVVTKEVTKVEPVKETKVVVIEKANEKAYTANLTGGASFYGEKWNGRRTANGEIFNTYELTAAHKSLPFGTKVKVVNKTTGKSVVVRINDRGPFVKGRTIDLSKKAFRSIASIKKGVLKDSEIDILVLKK
jgi:rare lipoprotein A